MSMHESGRMLLALYANSMVRLWNLLDARCLFKFKAGLSAQQNSDEESDESASSVVEEEKADKAASKALQSVKARQVLKQFDFMRSVAVKIMWEPTKGKQYAVLFSRVLEVYSVNEEEPVHSVTFDTNQTSFTYVGET